MQGLSRWLAAALLPLALSNAGAHDYAAGPLKIGHPWARLTVPGQTTGGGFMKIENTGGGPDRLLGAATPAADHVELHNMTLDGTVMRMRQLPAIELPAGQAVALEPGHLHLMLVGLKAPLKPGARVPLTLHFEKAGSVLVELTVDTPRPAGEAPSGPHQH